MTSHDMLQRCNSRLVNTTSIVEIAEIKRCSEYLTQLYHQQITIMRNHASICNDSKDFVSASNLVVFDKGAILGGIYPSHSGNGMDRVWKANNLRMQNALLLVM